jgi:hypothetical protein
MRYHEIRWLLISFMFVVILPLTGCDAIEETKGKITDKYGKNGMMREIERMYKKAKDAGEAVPDSVLEWAKQDIRKINDWEYRVIESGPMNPQEREAMLNRYGRERWECFWIEEEGELKRFHFKRRARSYLKHIPFKDLLKILPDAEA